MEPTEFRPIHGFPDYDISADGVVRRRDNGHILQGRGKDGRAVQLYHDGETYYRKRCDLVRLAWPAQEPGPDTADAPDRAAGPAVAAAPDESAYRPIPGYDNYEINLWGTVRRRESGRVILPCGRLRNSITLYQQGRQMYAKLADLVIKVWGRPMLLSVASVAEASGESAGAVASADGDELARLRDELAASEARARMLEVENDELRATLAACGVM